MNSSMRSKAIRHRAPRAAREQGGDDVDGIEVEAAPEVAAHRRLDDADALAGDAEGLGQVALIQERHLGGAPRREGAVGSPRGDGGHGAEARRGHVGQPVDVLDHGRRPGEAAVDVAVGELVAQVHEVGGQPLVHEGGVRTEGARRIEHGRQLLVLDAIRSRASRATRSLSAATAAISSRMQRTFRPSPTPPLRARWSFWNPNGCCSTSLGSDDGHHPGERGGRGWCRSGGCARGGSACAGSPRGASAAARDRAGTASGP